MQKPPKPPLKKPPPVKPREKPGMQKPPKPPPEKESAEDMDEPIFKDVEPEIEIEEE
jgi:hypothetical protein